MIRELSFALDEEEQALWDSAPEECFRYAIRRGALSLILAQRGGHGAPFAAHRRRSAQHRHR